MAPENVHLYYINKTLININIPRYKLFRNVSLKLSSLNKSSYEWSSKAIFNPFFPLKSSQRFTGTIQKRNQNSLEEDWMLHSRNKQLYVYPIRGPTKATWFHSLFSTYYYLILSCSLICSTVYYYLPHLSYKLSESKHGICLVLCSTSNTQHGVRQTVNVKSGSLKISWMGRWDKAKKTQLFPFISLYAIYPTCWSLWLFSFLP